MLPLFVVTLFLSATLLFLVQPLFAKMLLPLLGGTPAVWNTCVVFFQIALLAGYLYAHLTVRWLGVRRQALVHAAVLVLPVLVLPIHIRALNTTAPAINPIGWLFLVLVASVGLPFFAVSTTAPLLQRWFSATSHRAAGDPYFLYAASNAGSLLALIAYPTLIEPMVPLSLQGRLWAFAYALFAMLTLICGVQAWRSAAPTPVSTVERSPEPVSAVPWTTRLRWMALAAVPSTLMLSTSTYITTDIAAVPLLWIVPLAIYLLTFVLAFARRQIVPHWLLCTVLPVVIIPSVLAVIREETRATTVIPVHLATLFVTSLVCHGELARTRPPSAHLTDFYLSMSAGGALGGLFNTLVAPLIFTSAAEYPLGIVLACLLRPPQALLRPAKARDPAVEHAPSPTEPVTATETRPPATSRWKTHAARGLDVVLPAALGLVMYGLYTSAQNRGVSEYTFPGVLQVFALPLTVWLSFGSRPLRLALGLAAIFISSGIVRADDEHVLHAERTFFGIHQVIDEGREIKLLNGTTNHGSQFKAEEFRCRPTSYYHSSGPIGQIFDSFAGEHTKFDVGIVGLGTAGLAPYSHPGQRWTFYEINPAMERLATDPRYFTYLSRCIRDYRIVIGDARVSLAGSPDARHDVIVLDAFSSDAIPIHLLTREAIELYFRKLRSGGVIAVHISNRYLDLEPVLASLVQDTGLAGLIASDDQVSNQQSIEGKLTSTWVLLARTLDDLGPIGQDARWRALASRPGVRTWTDDFSDIIRAIDFTS